MFKNLAATSKVCLAIFLSLFSTNVLPAAAVYAAAPAPSQAGKQTICHATNSDTNPYTVNEVDKSSIDEPGNQFLNGHGDHTGPVWNDTLKDQKIDWGDIIPPFVNDAGTSYPGQNWTTEGQAIYNNNCVAPVNPEDEEITTPTVNIEVVCGPDNDIYSVTDTDEYDVVDNNDGTFTLTAATGFVFAANGLTTLTLTAPADENTECEVVDVCPNIDGVQTTVPRGMEINNDGNCVAKKVTICHRTNAVVNPYVVQTVDQDSVDGDNGNDNGQGDHYLEHTGPIFDPETMENGDDWGDIIPAIPGVHDGLNWTAEGQAIYNNNCNLPDGEGEPDLSFDYDDICTDEGQNEGEASVEIDNDGTAAANDLTVNLYDDEDNLVSTETVDVPADDDVEVVFNNLTEGSYTIRVFDGDTLLSTGEVEVDECGGGIIDVCPNVPGIQFVIPEGLVKDDQGNCVTDQCPLVPGVQTNTTLCPPGGGGGHVDVDGVSTSRGVLPATLPATGGETSPLAMILAMIAAYGAVYFLQGRRQLTTSRNL